MTTTPGERLHFEIQSRRRRTRLDWRRAIRAMRELVDHQDRTYLAFDINRALDPEMAERSLLRMLAQPEGRRVYCERPSLRERLSDLDALAAMPDGSFGRAYLAHIERHGLAPGKLVELGDESDLRAAPTDPDVRWMRERSGMTHDLWHVLTGYGADGLGEGTLLLFSLAQAGGRGNLLLAFGANLRILQERGLEWIPYAWKAWRRGRRATCLAALPYEELLPMPLADVRAAAGIEAPERAHPGGIAAENPIQAAASET
jgi:ubiquinone biosynthesis protein COQ4